MPKTNAVRLVMPRVASVQRLFISRRYSENFHADAVNEMLHIIDGNMKLRFQSGEEYLAGQNDTLFIPHGVMHKDIFEVSRGLEMFHITFKWTQADLFFSVAKPNCLSRISAKDKNEVQLLFDMFRLDSYYTEADKILAEARLAHLLGIGWRNVFPGDQKPPSQDAFSRLTAYAKDYMNAHFTEPIGIDQVAAFLHVSRTTLLRAFRHSSELSFNEYLRAVRMHHAYSLLRDRALNPSDCAARCGYADVAYFSKSFKKYFGFSPKSVK